MKRYCLLIAIALASLAAATGADGAGARPKLTLVHRAPLAVRGTGFQPSERVVVTGVTLTRPRRIVVRATRSGGFLTKLRVVNQPCGGTFVVRVTGNKGSRTILRLPAVPCVPPPIRVPPPID